MDSFYFNKVAGAVLASLLVLVGANTAIHLFYPKGAANLSKGRIVVAPEAAAPATPAAAKPAEKEPSVDSLLASANVEAGQNAAKACGACHNWTKGAGARLGQTFSGSSAAISERIPDSPIHPLCRAKAESGPSKIFMNGSRIRRASFLAIRWPSRGSRTLRRGLTSSLFSTSRAIAQSPFLRNSA